MAHLLLQWEIKLYSKLKYFIKNVFLLFSSINCIARDHMQQQLVLQRDPAWTVCLALGCSETFASTGRFLLLLYFLLSDMRMFCGVCFEPTPSMSW